MGVISQSILRVRSQSKESGITILSLKISCAHKCRTTSSRISVGKSRRPRGGWQAAIQVRARSATADAIATVVNGFGIQTFRDRGALPPTSVTHQLCNFPLAMRGYSRNCIDADDLRPLILHGSSGLKWGIAVRGSGNKSRDI